MKKLRHSNSSKVVCSESRARPEVELHANFRSDLVLARMHYTHGVRSLCGDET